MGTYFESFWEVRCSVEDLNVWATTKDILNLDIWNTGRGEWICVWVIEFGNARIRIMYRLEGWKFNVWEVWVHEKERVVRLCLTTLFIVGRLENERMISRKCWRKTQWYLVKCDPWGVHAGQGSRAELMHEVHYFTPISVWQWRKSVLVNRIAL